MNERMQWRLGGPAEGPRAQAHRLADEMRRIINRLVLVEAPESELAAAADAAAAFADRLDALPDRGWYEGFSEAANSGSPRAFFDHSPFLGLANPLAPPIYLDVVETADGERVVEGHAVFGPAYEGPPGSVHGGYVAAAFDEVLGFAQSLGGMPGMTGTLTVIYRKPTPLNTELTLRARFERNEGRKNFISGTCHAGDVLTAEAHGIFITVDFTRLTSMMGDRLQPPDGMSSGG